MFLLEVVEAFTKAKVPYAVAGGYAVALHGAIRGTFDVDFVISLKPQHLEAAEKALQKIGLTSRLPVTHEEISNFRLEYIQKRNLIAWSFVDSQNPTRVVDIILTEDISNQKVIRKRYEGITITLLSIESLIHMKEKAGRPQDIADIQALKKIKENSL